MKRRLENDRVGGKTGKEGCKPTCRNECKHFFRDEVTISSTKHKESEKESKNKRFLKAKQEQIADCEARDCPTEIERKKAVETETRNSKMEATEKQKIATLGTHSLST
jgi:hypothetical protein